MSSTVVIIDGQEHRIASSEELEKKLEALTHPLLRAAGLKAAGVVQFGRGKALPIFEVDWAALEKRQALLRAAEEEDGRRTS